MQDLRISSAGAPYLGDFASQTTKPARVETGPVGTAAVDQPRSSSRSIGPSPVTPSIALPEGINHVGNVYSDSRQKPSPNAGLQSASPSQRSEREEFQDIFSELMTGTEHEIAFLIRHYSETLGPWYVCHLVPDQYLLT